MRYQRNYDKALKSSVKVISTLNIQDIPIDIKEVIKKLKNVKIISYSEACKKYNCTINELIEEFQTDLGMCLYDEVYGRAIIFYNNTLNNEGLERFTIAHEFGHYILRHFDEINEKTLRRGGLTKHEYKVLEDEANCFARNFLSPAALVHFFRIAKYPEKISSIFDIGYKASNTRVNLFIKDYAMLNETDLNFFEKRFLKYVVYYSNLKDCSNCHGLFSIVHLKYCPICGSKKIKLHEGTDDSNMIYSGFELDSNSKVIKCYRCENESILDGEYCKICGANLVNRCHGTENSDYNGNPFFEDGCGALADGDARYCHICGKHTTFGYFGILPSWKEEKDKVEKKQMKGDGMQIAPNIPKFVEMASDDDLPF